MVTESVIHSPLMVVCIVNTLLSASKVKVVPPSLRIAGSDGLVIVTATVLVEFAEYVTVLAEIVPVLSMPYAVVCR